MVLGEVLREVLGGIVTDTEAQTLLTWLVTAYPEWRFLDKDQQKATSKVYRHMLRDLDADACGQACARIIATSKKLPTIAEIREATMLVMHGRRVLGGEAWGAVQKAIAREGIGKTPGQDFVWRDPVTARVVDAMGWKYLCGVTDDRAVADRARFIELYEQLARQVTEDTAVGELAPPLPRRQLGAPEPMRALVERVIHALPSGGDTAKETP